MAQTKPKYFYLGDAPKIATGLDPKEKDTTDNKLTNPLFNFDKTFSEKLNKITPLELAQSSPYIKLDIVDLEGNTKTNMNVAFFQKQINFDEISKGRSADRPLMSLIGVDIWTSEASGYFYYTHVTLKLKIHKKDDLSDMAVVALLFPGCPLRLEYGWNSPNEFLATKQTLSINVINYNLNIDKTGQADLTVECMAFNDVFTNAYIGDLGDQEDIIGEPSSELAKNYNQISKFLENFNSKEYDKKSRDYSLIMGQAEHYKSAEQRLNTKIKKRFAEGIEKLEKLKRNQKEFWNKTNQRNKLLGFCRYHSYSL
jgi:hypothetical protein